jgi:hypothetical protein
MAPTPASDFRHTVTILQHTTRAAPDTRRSRGGIRSVRGDHPDGLMLAQG